MKKHFLPLTIFFVILVGGCAPVARARCEMWKEQGQLYASIDSCVECAKQFGNNAAAASGCALGLDAGRLLAPQNPPAIDPANKNTGR